MPAIMTFSRIAARYLGERIVSRLYAANVNRVALQCGEVSVDRVNAYLRSRVASVSSVTVRSERVMLLTLYRFAYEVGMIDHAPRGVMRIKAIRKPTKAWTVPELQALIEATRRHDGQRLRSGADLGLFLRTWTLLAYECGARFGDCMAFGRDNLTGDALAWIQAKTGDPMVRPLSAACLEACAAMLKASPDGRIIGWACGGRMAQRHMRALIDGVGLTGTSKYLRRSGATHCEMERAGAGRLHLGHRSPALFEAAYCDWAQLRTKTPKTPAIA